MLLSIKAKPLDGYRITLQEARTANIMRIEESPPILKLIEENKKALIIYDRGFLQYDVQRHRQQSVGYCKVFCMSFEMTAE